ncbi:unnamed protein product, partial [Urochloa humidicola]
ERGIGLSLKKKKKKKKKNWSRGSIRDPPPHRSGGATAATTGRRGAPFVAGSVAPRPPLIHSHKFASSLTPCCVSPSAASPPAKGGSNPVPLPQEALPQSSAVVPNQGPRHKHGDIHSPRAPSPADLATQLPSGSAAIHIAAVVWQACQRGGVRVAQRPWLRAASAGGARPPMPPKALMIHPRGRPCTRIWWA